MGVLTVARALAALLAMAALEACYEPSLRDCTVTCSSASDCAGGQVCGDDGLCAAPEVAGTCARQGSGGPDAGALPRDAGSADARPTDAATQVELHVQIDGKGSIFVDDRGICSSQNGQKGDCTFVVPLRVPQTVRAVPVQLGESFKAWTSMTCKDALAVCTFTPMAATTVVARFGK